MDDLVCYIKKKKRGKKVLIYYSLVETWQPPLAEAQTVFAA